VREECDVRVGRLLRREGTRGVREKEGGREGGVLVLVQEGSRNQKGTALVER